MLAFIQGLVGLVLLGIVCLHLYRHYLLNKTNEALEELPFNGPIYHLGDNVVAKMENSGSPTKTVVCMPGFMETFSYYLDLYNGQQDLEIILVNNCFYHAPLSTRNASKPHWYNHQNPFQSGTIEHDAWVFSQVVTHLPTTDQVILHGHSRGGAVVLEAIKMLKQSGQFKASQKIAALLEAPVLPQGKARGDHAPVLMRMAMRYFMPIVFNYYRRNALAYLKFGGYKYPATDVKQHIIKKCFGNPKQYHITLTNVKSIDDWFKSNDAATYDYCDDVAVLVPERDIVLDRKAMLASAESSQHVKVIHVPRADHFISLERPDFVLDYIESLWVSESVSSKHFSECAEAQ
ncbi:MAG: alpha/beta hydrolase [Pseudomonadales bacterium]|nr:alpha/beta hydrolase [Pseudomonadales bacterium]